MSDFLHEWTNHALFDLRPRRAHFSPISVNQMGCYHGQEVKVKADQSYFCCCSSIARYAGLYIPRAQVGQKRAVSSLNSEKAPLYRFIL
jgi:hypothetical protein